MYSRTALSLLALAVVRLVGAAEDSFGDALDVGARSHHRGLEAVVPPDWFPACAQSCESCEEILFAGSNCNSSCSDEDFAAMMEECVANMFGNNDPPTPEGAPTSLHASLDQESPDAMRRFRDIMALLAACFMISIHLVK